MLFTTTGSFSASSYNRDNTKLEIKARDVNNAFLNGSLQEAYMYQPIGIEHEKYHHFVFKSKKALYDLRQVLHACCDRFNKMLKATGFT